MYNPIASTRLQLGVRRALHGMNTRRPKRLRVSADKVVIPHEEPLEEVETPQTSQTQHPRPKRRTLQHPETRTSEHCSYFSTSPGNGFRLGTSGYHYDFWHAPGSFYSNIPEKYEFNYYASEFDTVELNATFYRWFRDSVWDGWRARAAAIRPSFEYVIKAHQFYTHRKRLNVDSMFKESWGRFWQSCQRLGPHLGPILFQFPEIFKLTEDTLVRLNALGNVLDPNGKFVFEFRDISWFCPEVYDVLRRYNWCLAIVEVPGAGKSRGGEKWCPTLSKGPNPRIEAYPLDCCTWGAYVRFHGAKGKYLGAYGSQKMAEWARHFSDWAATEEEGTPSRRIYAAFNNTDDGTPPSAIADARSLAEGLRTLGYS